MKFAALGDGVTPSVARITSNIRLRSLIAFAGWSTLAHAFTMLIMSIEAWSHGMRRKDSPQDIVIVGAIGVLLLAALPARERASATDARGN